MLARSLGLPLHEVSLLVLLPKHQKHPSVVKRICRWFLFSLESTTLSCASLVQSYALSGATTDVVNRVEEVAKKKGLSMAQVSLAWIMNKEGKSSTRNNIATRTLLGYV